MFDHVRSLLIPAFSYFCNIVVFPAPDNDDSKKFLLKTKADVPDEIFGNLKVEYVPGSVYCLIPSSEKSQGAVSVYKEKPDFLDGYSYCLEINPESVVFPNSSRSDSVEDKITATSTEEHVSKRCSGCFVSHFPSQIYLSESGTRTRN